MYVYCTYHVQGAVFRIEWQIFWVWINQAHVSLFEEWIHSMGRRSSDRLFNQAIFITKLRPIFLVIENLRSQFWCDFERFDSFEKLFEFDDSWIQWSVFSDIFQFDQKRHPKMGRLPEIIDLDCWNKLLDRAMDKIALKIRH